MKKLFKNNFKYKLALFITMLGLIGLISGTSYAVLNGNLASGNQHVIKTGSVLLKLTENYESISKAIPVLSDTEGLLQEDTYSFNIRNIGDVPSSYSVKLVESVPSSYTGDVLDLKYIKVGLEINGEEHGPFSLVEVDSIIDSNIVNNDEIVNYELRLWIDEKAEDKITEIKDDKAFFKIEVEAQQAALRNLDKSGANAPVISENMIPVYYDASCNEEEGCWRKADSANKNGKYKWYNYDEKMWANSVTVSAENRSVYLKANLGTEISMDDILTMQVWVPRYKYTVWNYNGSGSASSNPQPIEIEFEKGTATTGEIGCVDNIQGTSDGTPTGTVATSSETCKVKETNSVCTNSLCNGKTYTHPAFTFGNKELEGIWVGKFEVAKDISCSESGNTDVGVGCNLTTIRPIVKPDADPLNNMMIGTYENNMMAMNDSDNRYGFAGSDDTHMIKNIEWGAMAYLSHSKYGTCTNGVCREISNNNSQADYTGRSGGYSSAGYSSQGTYRYNQTEETILELTGGTNINSSVTNDETYPWNENAGLYKSSTQGVDSSTTELEYSFTVSSNNTYLSFDWSVSSHGVSKDYLYYTIKKNGSTLYGTGENTKIGGTMLGSSDSNIIYKNVTMKLAAASYTLTFTYYKDYRYQGGTDTAYVKNVKILDNPEVTEKVVKLKEGEDGPSASTTGNIYGIYDTNGLTSEYVMGNMISPDGNTMMSGNRASNYNYSGYTGIVYYGESSGDFSFVTGHFDYPDDKYYDKYSFSKGNTQRNKSKLGDATREVVDQGILWYGNRANIVDPDSPWLLRGGSYNLVGETGIFFSENSWGNSNPYRGSRLVITQ